MENTCEKRLERYESRRAFENALKSLVADVASACAKSGHLLRHEHFDLLLEKTEELQELYRKSENARP